MLLVFWVLWRLRGLSWRETFAAVRLFIPGAVPSAAAVMGSYLRSFEANKLNEKQNQRLRGPFANDGALIGLMHPRDLCYRLRKRDREPALGLKPAGTRALCIAAG